MQEDDDLNKYLAEGLRMSTRGELALQWKAKAHPEMPTGDFMELMLVAGLQGQQEATGQSVAELVAEIFHDPEHQADILDALIAGRFIDADYMFTEKAREFL